MKVLELLESSEDKGISSELKKQGYRLLGRGVDQSAWLEPGTGLVLKIFGSERGSSPDKLTTSQKTFTKFANYCQSHPNNPFLPQFMGWEKFTFDGHNYLQIRCERLFEFSSKDKKNGWASELERMTYWVTAGKKVNDYIADRDNPKDDNKENRNFRELVTLLGGKDKLVLLYNTVAELHRSAYQSGFFLDLHPGNFMLGSDGHIVISDPFYNGY